MRIKIGDIVRIVRRKERFKVVYIDSWLQTKWMKSDKNTYYLKAIDKDLNIVIGPRDRWKMYPLKSLRKYKRLCQ